MKFLKQFFKSILLDEFVVYVVDSNGQAIDGYATRTQEQSSIIEEATEYFGKEMEVSYFLYN